MKERSSNLVDKIGKAGDGYLIKKVTVQVDTELVDWFKVYTWTHSGIVSFPPQFVAHAPSLDSARVQIDIREQVIERGRLRRIRSRNAELQKVREILARSDPKIVLFPQRSTKEPNASFQENLTTRPGKYESVYCGICDTKMAVYRNVVRKDLGNCSVSHRQYVAAGSPTKERDEYECPNIDCDWHNKICNLQLAMRDEVSDVIKQTRLMKFYHFYIRSWRNEYNWA